MTSADFPAKTPAQQRIALYAVLTAVAIGLFYHKQLWTFDASGLSIVSEKLPFWDFSNLWAGSKMALQGHVGDIFNVDVYRANLRAMFSPLLPDQEWSYPPNILLIGVPLALLPISLAYVLWTAGTIWLLHLAIRPLAMPWPAHLACLVSPPVFMNALFGQNGALTAALLLGGLLMAPRRPILAGVLFGLLTIKPHLGVLVPFCLLASWNWRAIVSASVTAITMAVLTGLIFGFEVWPSFFNDTRPLMTAILEAPYPQSYHANAITMFVFAQALGAGLGAAYAVQTLAALAAIAAVIWMWRPSSPIDERSRAVITATLTIVATPYGYSYDIIPLAVAVAWLYTISNTPVALLAAAWLFPYFINKLNYDGTGAAILAPIAIAAWLMITACRDQQSGKADVQALPADSPAS